MNMSILEPEADDLATVAEALAFIDACESPSSGNGSTSSDSGDSPLPDGRALSLAPASPAHSAAAVRDAEQPKPKGKRRSRNPPGYSTRLLHRKKAEMQQLREQAKQLEAKVEQLKRTRAAGITAIAAHAKHLRREADVKWMQMAMLELQRRNKAEYTNRRLKALLANQMKIDESLRAVVMKRSVLEGMDFVFEKAPPSRGPLAAVDNSSVIMAQLEKKASEMYLESKFLFGFEAGAPAISCEMKQRMDNQLGKMVEIVSSAPLACSMEAASSSLWKELTTIRAYPDKSYRYMQASKPNSMEKNFDQTIYGSAGAVAVNGLQFMRTFEEQDRSVLARAYKLLLPTEGLHLRGNAWTVFTRSESDPTDLREVRFFQQLYVEVEPGFSARAEDVAYLRDVAFETWSLKMRGHTQTLQELLIEAAAEAPGGASQFLMKPTC